MKLYIKNMVCDRCKTAVTQALDKSHIGYETIALGEVELSAVPSSESLAEFSNTLAALGFELIEDKKARVISKIKNAVIALAHHPGDLRKVKLSTHISETLNKDYDSLSALFSQVEGITLEKYFIEQKIERVKELLVYDELSLGQVAAMLAYSSVNHLSTQFKKVTGLTPTQFKKIGAQQRKSLDKV